MMAICADDLALLDLLLDGRPLGGPSDQISDIADLVAEMIELEYQGVRFPAVDTRVMDEVFE